MFGLSIVFCKKLFSQILHPIKHLISVSSEKGIFPSQLKTAKVIPLLISGDPYFTIQPNFYKIFEKVVSIWLTIFLENNNLLSNSQFGFRKSRSTIHPIMHFVNNVTKALNRKQHSMAIFCDLRKAFDTVDQIF